MESPVCIIDCGSVGLSCGLLDIIFINLSKYTSLWFDPTCSNKAYWMTQYPCSYMSGSFGIVDVSLNHSLSLSLSFHYPQDFLANLILISLSVLHFDLAKPYDFMNFEWYLPNN